MKTVTEDGMNLPPQPFAYATFDGEGQYDFREFDPDDDYKNEWERRNPKHAGWAIELYTAEQVRQAQREAVAAAVPEGFQNFPASNSSAAEDAMGKVWEERNFPCNPRAAARCGWEAAHRVIKSLIAAAPEVKL